MPVAAVTSTAEPSQTASPVRLRVVDRGEFTPIVLIGASADAATLHEAHAVLERPRVELLLGIEDDVERLREAIATAESPTLFVLCRTANLGAVKARPAVECFTGRRAAGHRLLVVELEPRRGTKWLGTVRAAAAALTRAQVEPSTSLGIAGMRDSGSESDCAGETSIDAASNAEPSGTVVPLVLTRERIRGDDERGAQKWLRDDVGPIPAHVRAPGSPASAGTTVVERIPVETLDDGPAAVSDALLTFEPAANDAGSAQHSHAELPAMTPDATPRARLLALAVVVAVVTAFALLPLVG